MSLGGIDNTLAARIHMSDASLQKILDQLDLEEQSGEQDPDPSSLGFPFRRRGVLVQLRPPFATTPSTYLVFTRSLSASELSFLHGSFVHNDSQCVALLEALNGTTHAVAGRVHRCTHADGMVHEVRVRFQEDIDPQIFCPEAVRHSVLVVDDDPMMIALARHYLEDLNAAVDEAPNGQVAVEKALAQPYDLILMDIGMPVCDGIAATRELRQKGYAGMIVAYTAMNAPDERARCIGAGLDIQVPKPCSAKDFVAVLRTAHSEVARSSLSGDVSMHDLINAFVASLPDRVISLQHALEASDLAGLIGTAAALREGGGSVGYAGIVEAAKVLEGAAKAEESGTPAANGPEEATEVEIKAAELVRQCRIARGVR